MHVTQPPLSRPNPAPPQDSGSHPSDIHIRSAKKSGSLVRSRDGSIVKSEAFRLIDAHRAEFSVEMMCRVLGVSSSGYYAWRGRPTSNRRVEQAKLIALIRLVHDQSWGTYGAPRVHAEINAMGVKVSLGRIERLMRSEGLQGVIRRKFKRTTRRSQSATLAPDLVGRDFTASAPNQLWVADFTYQWTDEGWAYVAGIQDVFSRVIVGYHVGDRMTTDLVLRALEMALWRRRPGTGLMHHSDQGSQYTALRFSQALHDAGIQPSMGSVGCAYDNAMAESWIGTLKAELLDKHSYADRDAVALDVFHYVEGLYNPRRRHTSLGMLSPLDYERQLLTHRHEDAA